MKSKNKFKKTIFFLLLFLSFDFFLTKYFFKKTIYWSEINNNYFPKSAWRIKSDIYHHDIAKNVNTNEKWGSLKYKLITNSLGFRDLKQNNIKLKNDQKKRIYVVGDSFIEGVGFDYEYTAIGMATKNLFDKYEILNSSVTSYSPSIYYRKTKHYIDKGIQFKWYPFQIAFQLVNIVGLCALEDEDPGRDDREIIDLAWFPTGGGKTEAYLGLISMTGFYRRLRFPENELNPSTHVVMRYTLRLLTSDQADRLVRLAVGMNHIASTMGEELGVKSNQNCGQYS